MTDLDHRPTKRARSQRHRRRCAAVAVAALALLAACSSAGDDDDSTATVTTTSATTTDTEATAVAPGGPITVAIDGADEVPLGDPLALTLTLTNSGERSVAAPVDV